MTGDPLQALLAGEFQIAEIGERLSCPIKSLVIDHSLDGRERDLLNAIGFDRSLVIVSDANTHDVLAGRLANALPGAGLVVVASPKADEAHTEQLIEQTRHADALVAVGSGTINDLVKHVSHVRRRPYAVFATAPSMNGYVTATASISRQGQKLSLPATPPLGAFFDLTVLAEAPRRLVQAGVGDSLCRSTAEIDWLLSHHLFDTPFLETPFTIQAQDEATLLARMHDLEGGDLEAIQALVRLLVLGGLGMLIAGSSQPGSQGEHLVSHYIDMMIRPHPGSFHGEQVGLATLTMAALQRDVLSQDRPPVLAKQLIDIAAMRGRFGRLSAACEAALSAKTPSGDHLEALNRRLEERWPALRAAFDARALLPDRLGTAFKTAGVGTSPENLGLSRDAYREAVVHARELRDRFTMLDLAAMSNRLTTFADEHLSMEPK